MMKRISKRIIVAAVFVLAILFANQSPSAFAVYSCGTYGAGSYNTEGGCTPSSGGGSSTTDGSSTDPATPDADSESDTTEQDDTPTTEITEETTSPTENTDTSAKFSDYVVWSFVGLGILLGALLLYFVLRKRKDKDEER